MFLIHGGQGEGPPTFHPITKSVEQENQNESKPGRGGAGGREFKRNCVESFHVKCGHEVYHITLTHT